jgi:hypothetical protein
MRHEFAGLMIPDLCDDPERAAASFSVAALAPGSHQGKLARLAATFYNKADRDTEALDVLIFLYETSENPDVKRHIGTKIEEIMQKPKSED